MAMLKSLMKAPPMIGGQPVSIQRFTPPGDPRNKRPPQLFINDGPAQDSVADHNVSRPIPDESDPSSRPLPPPRQPSRPLMPMAQGAPAGNRLADMYNRGPGLASLINPTPVNPGGQEDRQKMMDMQRETYRRFLAPPAPPPVTPPILPPGTPQPGTPQPGTQPNVPELGGFFNRIRERALAAQQNDYGDGPGSRMDDRDFLQTVDYDFDPRFDLEEGMASGLTATPETDLPPAFPPQIPNLPVEGIAGLPMGDIGVPIGGRDQMFIDDGPPPFDPNIMLPRDHDISQIDMSQMPAGLPQMPVSMPAISAMNIPNIAIPNMPNINIQELLNIPGLGDQNRDMLEAETELEKIPPRGRVGVSRGRGRGMNLGGLVGLPLNRY